MSVDISDFPNLALADTPVELRSLPKERLPILCEELREYLLDDCQFDYRDSRFKREPDRWLMDGDTVTVGNLTLDVIHCPGHTPGHVIFHHAPSRLAIVGDVLFQGSIGRTDFPRGNHADLINAITTKLWPLGDDVTFIPGHGPTSQFGYERQHNAFVADDVLAAR